VIIAMFRDREGEKIYMRPVFAGVLLFTSALVIILGVFPDLVARLL
jgi:hypothetical protein